ncbi:MAG: TolC family protein [Cyclobacteriaceae bacterium]|nr:TolC family protein [Cyclobacteriaceae bacterium]
MNRKCVVVVFFYLIVVNSFSQNVFSITDVIGKAQSQSPAFKQTETRLQNSYWQYRFYRTNYNPQIRMNSNQGALYTNSITPIRQPDGSIIYRPVNQFNPGVNFSLQQPIQWTNGTISVNSSYNYFKDITSQSSQWNGAPMYVQLNQPLLSYNPYKWDKKIQPIRYEESKRDYAEAMEQISRDAVNFFFGVMDAQVNLQIAKYNLANNDTIYKIEKGRYNIGTTSEDKLLQVELQLLRSRQDVGQANLALQTASLALRNYIGLRNGESFDLILPEEIPIFTVSEEEALEHAKRTRSAYVAFERRKMEAQSAVAQVRGQLYQVGVTAAFGLNNTAQSISDLYQNPSQQQIANVTFSVPIVDWGRRKAQMQTAYAIKKLNDYIIAQDEVTFDQEILTQVRQFEMLYLQVEITKKSDEVALKRYNVAQNRYLIGKIDITNLNIALTEKDNAKRGYITALRSFWTAYYDLRRLTLYDFSESKFLYNPNEEG